MGCGCSLGVVLRDSAWMEDGAFVEACGLAHEWDDMGELLVFSRRALPRPEGVDFQLVLNGTRTH